MGFFDNIDSGLTKAGGILERGAAAGSGNLHQYDAAQQGIAESKQRVTSSKVTNLSQAISLLQEAALSGDNSPEFLGPRIDGFAAAFKEAGVNIPKGIIDHLKNNPVALGASFDPEVIKELNPIEQKELSKLTQGSLKNPTLIKERDRMLGVALYRKFGTVVAELEAEGVPRADAMSRGFQRVAGKYAMSAGGHHEFAALVKDGMAFEKEKVTAKSPTTGDALLIQEAEEKFPNDKAAQRKYVFDTKSTYESAATRKSDEDRDRAFQALEEQRRIDRREFQQREDRLERNFQLMRDEYREVRNRITPPEKKEMDNLIVGYELTDKLQKLHKAAADKQGGKLSSAFRNALATSQSGNRFVNLLTTDGFSPEEKALAAQYNTIYGSLYNLTQERALTEADAVRNLTSYVLSNDPVQVQLNLQSRKDQFASALEIKRRTNEGQGRNTGGYDGGPRGNAPQQSAPAAQALPKGIPSGSKLIGKTASGGMVYETPNGKKLVSE